ncbi:MULTISPECIES: type II secretion system minor pseudopilin GspI [unclassified Pseudomonas]|uniref:type II secretion system minor pseudopilin GspI n=1 Tax=unclassified Pseudomonas TaxID=196821 RepID=UPI0011990BFD|nr:MULTISPECIES: type II secretion system minor pseudopilin GspI [unclassified Pseudomonas]TWC10534.1 type II secretion system protein I (GspI) [Pseudomonas sp. SJZ075]TWC26689.1 type II secretion system protein I (GspI) [Pseudomonas sp. SJZ078]TWC45854.1 type II secretion system protein I (GspI) [Pseudomonas sp. SJZ124]TWC46119.1 type II secretion system protein I (GspI) [Pseudomonas sp. SJZ080]TWC81131.1 type II secretion system protein I (GspI) [Pseudomonas sp. SJZ101]
MSEHHRSRGVAVNCKGFTLLEVMVAMVIFATLAAAVMSASQFVLRQSAGLETRLFGVWLADNQLSELRLQSAAALGQQRLTRRLDHRNWILEQYITPAHEPRLLKVDIQVRIEGNRTLVHRTTGWIDTRDE